MVLVTVGNTSGKKQVLEMVSSAKVVATEKPLNVSQFSFYSIMQAKPFVRKGLEELIFQKVDRPELFNSRKR